MKAILHLGTEKTGTSSVQRYFHQNREKLISQGFYFLKSTGLQDDRKLAVYAMLEKEYDGFHLENQIKTREDKAKFEKELAEKFIDEVRSLPRQVHTVIISSEHFHSRLGAYENVKKLRGLLDREFSDYHLIAYLRPQVDVSVSHYSTALKTKSTATLSEHLKNCSPSNYYYDYKRFLDTWESAFPESKMSVRIFDRKLLEGNNVVTDVCNILGVIPDGFKEVGSVNESVRPTGQEILRNINSRLPAIIDGVGKNNERQELVRLVSRLYSGSGKKPAPEEAERIQDQFFDINEGVRKRWFPEKNKLFDIKFEKYSKDEPVDNCVVSLFVGFLDQYEKVSSKKTLVRPALNPETIDALRDYGLDAEREGDIPRALTLMKAAQAARPTGPLINKKVEEYRHHPVSQVELSLPKDEKKELECSLSLSNSFSQVVFMPVGKSSLEILFSFYPGKVRCVLPEEVFREWGQKNGKVKERASIAIHYAYALIKKRICNSDFFWSYYSSSGFGVGDRLKVVFNFGDGIGKGVLGLCYDASVGDEFSALIPDNKFYIEKGFSQLREQIASQNMDAWERKKDKAFWRGSVTGAKKYMISSNEVSKIPRLALCLFSVDNFDFLDAKVAGIPGGMSKESNDLIRDFVDNNSLGGEKVSFSSFSDYKYLIEIDGNVTPWSFLQKLMLGSCVLRVESDRKQWYYDQLEEWVHYVPVKQDMSDLIEKIQWCKDNDDKAREIAQNGQRFADSLSFDSQMNFAAEQLLSAARVVSE